MLINEEVYKFEIWYIDHEKGKEKKFMYSDSDDIFNLEGVPQTTFGIYVYHKNLDKNQQFWDYKGYYMIGDKITLKEAEEEIKVVRKLDDEKSLANTLKTFCKNERNNIINENAKKIYLNKNIEWDNASAVSGRIRIVPPSKNYNIISPNQIANGRVYPARETKRVEIGDDKSYIDLE